MTVSPLQAKSIFPVRKSYARLPNILNVPNLIEIQLNSFRWFLEEGLKVLLNESSPINDVTSSRLELRFTDYEFRTPASWKSEEQCRQRDLTYSAPLYVRTQLLVKETGEIKEQALFFGDIPLMTPKGTFIISGAERVVVSQLLRSPGVYFTSAEDPATGRSLSHAKLIPTRGAWLEFETSNRDIISAKIDGKRKIPITTLLRAIGYGSDEQLLDLFAKVDSSAEHQYIKETIEREPQVKTTADAAIDIHRKLRPGEPHSQENAEKLIDSLFFNPLHYDLGNVGRYKLNKRLALDVDLKHLALTQADFVEIIRHMILINNDSEGPDDIDHLGNRRVRTVGELIQNQFRIGLLHLQRVIRERMSITAIEAVTPSALVNIRPIVASIREFFGSSQLSQFMDQTNPLAGLTNKRRLSAIGPGGLSRERAGFDIRDVHHSHYGRICPIETPEGPNIGLIGSLATYGRINRYGFIETPYRWVVNEIGIKYEGLAGKTVKDEILDSQGRTIIKSGTTLKAKHINQLETAQEIRVIPCKDGIVYVPDEAKKLIGRKVLEAVKDDEENTVVKAHAEIGPRHASKLFQLSSRTIKVAPFVSDEVVYLSADKEEEYAIAQANARLDKNRQFIDAKVEARLGNRYLLESPGNISLMDVSPQQVVSVTTALIPFLEHNDANRALMGSNMQRQAVPLIHPEAPIVATGMENESAKYSGEMLFANNAGVVTMVTGSEIRITRDEGGEDIYPLMKFVRTNQGTCINQRPIVSKGDRVEAGRVLVNTSSTENGELALGQNVLCAFMSWRGYNYEDAIIISERLLGKDKFSSVHIEKYEVEARDTKLGPEEITRDIPNVGEESLRDLDEHGIIRAGAEVGPDDILVGKITPKGETELSAEEKLLRAIFGEKAREVKDTSKRVPHGEWGKVIDVRVFTRDKGDELPAKVNEWVQVWVAQKRKISVGDKMSGRHGNKGIVSLISPVEDMPFLPDGTPVDIILNPIGVPSRMNIGQVLETHLGWAAQNLGFKVLTPVFDGASDLAIEDALARVWLAQKAGAIGPTPDYEQTSVQLDLAKAWVNSQGFDGEKAFSDDFPGLAKEACLHLWLEENGIDARSLSVTEMEQEATRLGREKNTAPPTSGKVILRDGHTGEPFDQPVTIGNIYMMKLIHLVEDKVHARSTGPYSLISQQPLGGKAQFGGQRFGEMEVWALEAYGAAHTLQEILTIKSDDVTGRAKTYEAIVKNEDIVQLGVPESFKVLVKELQSLGLSIEVLKEEERALPEEALTTETAESTEGLETAVTAGTVENTETLESAETLETKDTTETAEAVETVEAPDATETAEATEPEGEAKPGEVENAGS